MEDHPKQPLFITTALGAVWGVVFAFSISTQIDVVIFGGVCGALVVYAAEAE